MPPVATLAATIETVLLETDVPDLVLARDVVGTLYLCSFVSRDRDGDRFLCIPVSSERLAAFRSGQLDLRSLLTRPETGAWFDGLFHSVEGRPTIELERI